MKRLDDAFEKLAELFVGKKSDLDLPVTGITARDLKRILALGLFMGGAEKVRLHVCRAAMYSPPKDWAPKLRDGALEIASAYGIYVMELPRAQRIEFWFASDERDLIDLQWRKNDNVFRAILCGLPDELIDPNWLIEAPL